MCVDRGGMGVISPNIQGGGWPVLIIIPQYLKVEYMSYHTDKISEVPTIIMKEISYLECRNANFSSLPHIILLVSRCGGLPVICEAFTIQCVSK